MSSFPQTFDWYCNGAAVRIFVLEQKNNSQAGDLPALAMHSFPSENLTLWHFADGLFDLLVDVGKFTICAVCLAAHFPNGVGQ